MQTRIDAQNQFMKKKVLIVLGSPRKNGNSATLAAQIAKGAMSAQANVETVYLQEKNIAPCTACRSCLENSGDCIIQDDMQEIYEKLVEADGWVIASPVYWFTMTAQTKIFMDRCYALNFHPERPFKGKPIAIAMAYGGGDPFESGCVNALRTFQDAYRYTESVIVGMVYGSSMDTETTAPVDQIVRNEKVMQDAFELGRNLVSA
jgi:multimeric flavodoxin WrbA